MRVLIIHHEAEYFAGAEVLLGYFLEQIGTSDCRVTVAAVRGSRAAGVIPTGVPTLWLAPNARFSFSGFVAQVLRTARFTKAGHFDVIHGWAARDWELAAIVSALTRCPAVATLHDHPQATFISPRRQTLMRWCANWGLARLICISQAVESACEAAGYSARKLAVIHNGLPRPAGERRTRPGHGAVRLGFLGAISERKGLRGLFRIVESLGRMTSVPWELFIAGAPQNSSGEQLQRSIQLQYEKESWYARVHWCGWVNGPLDFLAGIDVLICPSSEFEPFGLVLCEAGWMGIPVLATRTGGIAEIVEDGKTGWLIEIGDWGGAAERLAPALEDSNLRRAMGERGRERVGKHFTIEKMVAQYVGLYSTLRAVL